MRRACTLAMLVMATTVRAASGDPTTVTAEGGGEIDTNVVRVETGPGLETEPVTAPVGRLGAKVDHRGRIAGGVAVLGMSSLIRVVADPAIESENVALLAGDLRYQRAIGKRNVSAGFAINAADAIPFGDALGSRTFRTLAADGVLVLRHSDDRSLSLAAGRRAFQYKPDGDYDWAGPTLAARLDLMLWQPSDGARSVELSVGFGYEGRAYDSTAFVSACPDDAEPDPMCFASTMRQRHDRYQRANAEVTWVGRAVTTAGYLLTVVDSNSYGQSLVRHRATVSVTTDLFEKFYGTALGILQFDQYLDGLVVQKGVLQQEFTSLDDENRSSLQLRLARQMTDDWSIEGRVAIWRDLGGTIDSEFKRELVYIGAIYSH